MVALPAVTVTPEDEQKLTPVPPSKRYGDVLVSPQQGVNVSLALIVGLLFVTL